MSLWNRLGEVASVVSKNAVKFGGEVFGAATAPARFAWDVATAPWNDNKEYNGFVNTFKSATEDSVSRVVKPLASAGGAIMKVPGVAPALEKINEVNQNYIREPLTTYELVQGEVNKTGPQAFFDPNVWRKAYKGSQEISFGQAFVSNVRSYYDPKFNIYDPAQRDAAFKKSAWGKYTSGATDLGIQFFGDVTLAAGKAAKVLKASELGTGILKNADTIAQAAEDITKAQYGVKNRFTKVLDDFTNNDSAYAISHPMVKSSSQPGLLAYMLGQSKTVDETSLILRSALSDPAAMDELAFARADLTDALKAARGDLNAVDEYKLYYAPEGSGMIPFLNDAPGIIDEAEKNYKALAQSDEYFAKLMQLGEGGGALTRTTGKLGQGVEDLVAQGRATKFYDKSVGSSKVDVFQPTPFHKLYQKVSWLAAERPAGLVDFNDPDSYKEIIATLSQAEKIAGFTPAETGAMLDSYIKAATPEARYAATMGIENRIFRAITKKHGVEDESLAEKIYNNYKGARTSALKSVKDKGFMVDTDGSIIKIPQLESQSADYLPMMDFALMNKLLKRNGSIIQRTAGAAADVTVHYVDLLQDAFKAGALLRLGYTQRNAIDSQLRIMASVGAMASLRHLGPGVKNFVYNTVKEPARLVDRFRPIDAGRTYAEVQSDSVLLAKQLDELKTKIGNLEAKYSISDKTSMLNDEELVKSLNPNMTNTTRVGLVNTDFVKKFVEFDRNKISKYSSEYSDETISKITEDLKSGKGFTDRLYLEYAIDQNGKLYLKLVEGNHRIQAAINAGVKEVPVTMVKVGDARDIKGYKATGFDSKIKPDDSGWLPSDSVPRDVLPDEVLKTPTTVSTKDAELGTELNTLRQLREEKLAIYNHNAGVLSRNQKMTPKQRIASGSYEVTTADGQTYILDDAFGGSLGEMFRRIASSGNSFERMVDSNSDFYARTVASKGIQAIRPTDKGYFEQWAQTLRQQFGNSAVVKQLNSGKSIDEVTQWLVSSPEGRDLRRRLSITSADAKDYVARINGFFDTYLPVTSNLRPKLAEITADDLRTTFKDPSDLPIIHGHLLEDTFFNASDGFIKKGINGLFKLLGTMPEDAWARHPLYAKLYRDEVKRRMDVMVGLKEDGRLTFEEQGKAMSMAHKYAQREMKNILFNIERRSNLAAAMKYISPFFSAQENAYKTWMKLSVANPAIVNRAYNIWQSPNRAGLVTDYEGNPVPEGQTSGNDIIWVSMPKGLSKIPGLSSLTTLGIPKGSLDIIFQGGMDAFFNKGNPNFASDILPVGPYVAVPVSELVKRQPDFATAFAWAIPFGPSKNAASGFLPSWMQKAQVLAANQSDPQFAKTYQLIFETEQQKAKEAGQGPVDPKKIMAMTQDYWKMRIAANLIMPFAPQFNSPYKFYLDKAREYRRIYGINADAKFLNDYPDFFDFTTTLSKNPTGVQSSLQAVKNIKKYSGLVGELAKIDPKLVGLVVNDPSGYDFSQAAYDYLYGKQVSADSPDKFLSSQSPAEAQKKTDAEKGWIKYNQLMDIIDDELKNRGLTSVQQKGAEDLAAVKSAVINKLAVATDAEGKPIIDKKTGTYQATAWYDDYLDSDGSKTNKVINGLGKIFSDKQFLEDNKNNPMWKSVHTYLEFRKIIANELLQRTAKSITAKENTDLKMVYDSIVNKLKGDDKMGFAYVYDRFLSQDLIFDKYLTPKAGK